MDGHERIRACACIAAALVVVPMPSSADDAVAVSERAAMATPELLPPRPHLQAVRTSDHIELDGRLTDAAWAKATPTRAFTQKFPNEAQAPGEPTDLRVLYDDSALYIGFDCVQTGAAVSARLARRDRQVEADWVQVAIDDGTNAYEFSVNAAGVLGDAVRFNDIDYSADWDGVWDARVAQHDHGWSAEMRIPLRIFRRSGDAQDWGFQARRYVSLRQETDEWAFIPRAVAGEVSHYGRLSGIAEVPRANPLELLPYASTGVNWAEISSRHKVFSDFGYDLTAGLDLALRVGQDLTLDASFNPDFAQVEADQVVFNLTTFETFVPEKRPFFVNGMAMFQLPRMELFPSSQTLFYTRRIGSVPGALAIDGTAGERAGAPEPSTIYAAAKLTGKLADAISVGLVSAVTGRNDVTVDVPAAPSRDRLVEPLAFANVARVKVGVGGGAGVGVTATALRRVEPDGAYPTTTTTGGEPTQRCPDGSTTPVGARCFHDSYVAGLDGSWRSPSGTYVVAGQGVVTSIQNGPPRTMLDGTVIKSGDTAASGRVYLAKEGGNWLGSVEAEGVGRRVDFNDLGYLTRQNQVRFIPYLAYRTLTPFWEIAETETHVYAATRDNLDGLRLLRGYYAGGKVRFKNFWTAETLLFRYDTRFEDREVGDGTALQRPSATGLDVNVSTDPRRQIAASIATETLVYAQGRSFSLDAAVTYLPLPRLELQLLPQLTTASGEQRYVSGSRMDGGYLFGALRARSAGATLRSSYTFTNRLTLQLYGQLLLTAKHYSDFRSYDVDPAAPRPAIRIDALTPVAAPASSPDTAETDLNLSAVLRWEFRPGSTLFLVYSRSQTPEQALDGEGKLDLGALRHGMASDALRLKLSYYWN
jgi:hypothetical protein